MGGIFGTANLAGPIHYIPANTWQTVLSVPIFPWTATGFLIKTNHKVPTLVKWRAYMASPPFYMEGSFSRGGLGVPVFSAWGPFFSLDLWCATAFRAQVFEYGDYDTLRPVNQI